MVCAPPWLCAIPYSHVFCEATIAKHLIVLVERLLQRGLHRLAIARGLLVPSPIPTSTRLTTRPTGGGEREGF